MKIQKLFEEQQTKGGVWIPDSAAMDMQNQQTSKQKQAAQKGQATKRTNAGFKKSLEEIRQKIRDKKSDEEIIPDVINLLKAYESGK